MGEPLIVKWQIKNTVTKVIFAPSNETPHPDECQSNTTQTDTKFIIQAFEYGITLIILWLSTKNHTCKPQAENAAMQPLRLKA